jgi:hypothetical protein
VFEIIITKWNNPTLYNHFQYSFFAVLCYYSAIGGFLAVISGQGVKLTAQLHSMIRFLHDGDPLPHKSL